MEGFSQAALEDVDVSLVTESGGAGKAPRFIMAQGGIKLEEKLWVDECYLFTDESLTPIFCKPKLIPLKTITTQKLEQMQREQMEKLKVPEKEPEQPETINEEEGEGDDQPSTSEPKGPAKEADVWTADD